MATTAVEEHSCVTPNCGGKAKLRCPNCVKLGILDGSYFVRKTVLKVIGQNIKNYMDHRVCRH